jgi:hypothetical protein
MKMSDPRDSIESDTPLMMAIRKGDAAGIEQILNQGKLDLSKKNALNQDILTVYRACYPEFFSKDQLIAIVNLSDDELENLSKKRSESKPMYEVLKKMLDKIRSNVVAEITDTARSAVKSALVTSAYLEKKHQDDKPSHHNKDEEK